MPDEKEKTIESPDKNQGGRPTDYTPELLVMSRIYLEKFKDLGDLIPTIAGLSLYIKISRQTIYEWSKDEKKKEFSDIVEAISGKQEKQLIENGLENKYNATITKLLLSKHGYHDKVDQDLTSGGKPIPILGNLNVPKNDGDKQDSQP